ncbi:MarR family transcriptional regulator [Pasteurella skyensis]|uniref:MarR family transcriptional regulator n=1 Tax=Phocoenobacter skyensis TaxID=97481 RepID=A0AAJ6NAR8_9PAST|nr:MarR family transcriptional regulator [Pasteurella skyensis]MDP8163213.1 MarR family transcriptional regulator [Pasteurella skyensis]MDP8173320.1 MarR family transcriptional regulator [Pasteurella skyensis]MDP8176975.1 MarR family transcriptional regulator [Pasteurella skyensis]MDP8179730.1 MarR family transcriptional regulator [Pasteurella skyensis]MDP8182677.1 MarR family transcriptional regulator [Pasteurella skyensis]
MNYRQQMDLITTHIATITQLYHECAKLHGMTYNTMMVLGALRHHQTCTQKQIVETWGLPKQSVNTIIKKLHNEQKVEFSQGRNNKEKLVQFTDKGKVFSDTVLQPILAMEERVLQHIGEKECQQLENTMAKFATFFTEEFCAYQKDNA